jgi:23S rRNA (adenine2503-C2)-methyltransferase
MSLDKQHEQMADKIVDRIQDLVEEAAPVRRVKKEKPNLKPSIYSLRLDELKDWLTENGEKAFRAAQVFEWLYEKRVKTYDEMTNLPKGLREKLEAEFVLTTLSTIVKQESKDGTIKFLFQLQDGYSIETVLMRHDYGNSICVTTQVGCRIGCTFCASTLGGLKRHLMAGEIVEQVVKVQQILDDTNERVSSIVIMGIGEPFDNYDAMMNFLKIVNHDKGLNIGARHITVSTSGIVPKIYEFADEGMQINFAVSLHAPNQEARQKLMPIARAYKLDELLEAVRYYTKKTGRRVTFEYGLMSDQNDSVEIAEELSALIKNIKCHVNLIPINYVPERDYIRTSKNKIFEFERTLKKNGINVTIRREQGADIAAACGQLRAMERAEETK